MYLPQCVESYDEVVQSPSLSEEFEYRVKVPVWPTALEDSYERPKKKKRQPLLKATKKSHSSIQIC